MQHLTRDKINSNIEERMHGDFTCVPVMEMEAGEAGEDADVGLHRLSEHALHDGVRVGARACVEVGAQLLRLRFPPWRNKACSETTMICRITALAIS